MAGETTEDNRAFHCINPARFEILLTIIRSPQPLHGSEISRQVNMNHVRVGRHLTPLENAGLIEGTPPPNQRAGHRVTYTPTEEARGLFDTVAQTLEAAWKEREGNALQ